MGPGAPRGGGWEHGAEGGRGGEAEGGGARAAGGLRRSRGAMPHATRASSAPASRWRRWHRAPGQKERARGSVRAACWARLLLLGGGLLLGRLLLLGGGLLLGRGLLLGGGLLLAPPPPARLARHLLVETLREPKAARGGQEAPAPARLARHLLVETTALAAAAERERAARGQEAPPAAREVAGAEEHAAEAAREEGGSAKLGAARVVVVVGPSELARSINYDSVGPTTQTGLLTQLKWLPPPAVAWPPRAESSDRTSKSPLKNRPSVRLRPALTTMVDSLVPSVSAGSGLLL